MALLPFALFTAACGYARDDQAGVSLSTTTSAPPSARPTVEAKPSPVPTATATATVAFPEMPLITGTTAGELRRSEKGDWKLESHVCASGQEVRAIELAAAAGKVLVRCLAGGAGPEATRVFLYDLASRTQKELAWTISTISPDARYAVSTTFKSCDPAPVPCRRATLVDLQTGREREIFPMGPGPLGMEMRWTSLGLSYFVPECADAGCSGLGGKVGTYVWSGTAWNKISDDRLVATDGAGTVLLERLRSYSAPGRAAVVLRTATTDVVLTSSAVEREYAIALLDGGRVAAWRPDGVFGSIVIYDHGQVVRQSRGRFDRFQATRVGDWIIASELGGAPSFTLLAYSISQDAFAAKPANLWLVGLAVLTK